MKVWKFSTPLFDADKLNENLKYNPWAGHRKFAYDLTSFIKPECIVELGTHYGCSFFSFAQAIKDFKMPTKLVSVDSWKGDPQTGFYDEDVIKLVKKTISQYFPELSIELKHTYFHQALTSFDDSTIDVLHIDGFHDYEHISEDFYSWLPKLKTDGIILLHDTAEYSGYGSAKFWIDLKKKYKYHFEFQHSWGLGILFLSEKNYRTLNISGLFSNINCYLNEYLFISTNDRVELIRLKNELNYCRHLLKDKEKKFEKLNKKLSEKDCYIEQYKRSLVNKEEYIKSLKQKLK